MARKDGQYKDGNFLTFNVVYEDGMKSSNRRVLHKLLDRSRGGSLLDLARCAIEEQDKEIARLTGQLHRRAKVRSLSLA